MNSASGGDGPLVGRDDELLQIGDLLKAASEGAASVVLLTGESGIGKTALLDAVLNQARGLGFTVGQARGSRLEGEFGFGVVRRLFETPLATMAADRRATLLAEIGDQGSAILGDSLSEDQVDQAGFEVHHALYRVMAALAENGPLVFAVDDVHLADEPSLRYLAYAARRLSGLEILLLFCATDGDTREDPASLDDLTFSAQCFTLEPLTEQEAAEVVRMTAGDTVARQLAPVCSQVVDGNPFLLHALLTAMERRRRTTAGELTASTVFELGSSTVAERLHARFRGNPDVAALARAVTVLGDHAEFSRAAALADLALHQAAQALDSLVRMRIMENSSPLRFHHVLVRNAVLDDMPIGARLTLHARAAGLLYDVQAGNEEVASHLLHAGLVEFPWAGQTLHRAGMEAVRRGAPDVATEYLRHALLQTPNRERRALIMLDLGDAEMACDPAAGVARLRTALAEAADARAAATVVLRLAPALYELNAYQESLAMVDRVLADLPADEYPELVWHLRCLATALSWSRRETTRQAQEEERDLFAHAPATPALWRAGQAHLAMRYAWQGHSKKRILGWGRNAMADPDLLVFREPYYYTVLALINADDEEYTSQVCQSADRLALQSGMMSTSAISLLVRGIADYVAGSLPQARAHLSSALELFDQWDISGGSNSTILCVARLVEVLTLSGEYDDAWRLLLDRQLGGDLPERVQYTFVLYARAQVRRCADDRERAIGDLLECGRRAEEWSLLNPAILPWRSALAAFYLGGEDQDQARALAEEELARARRWGTNRSIGVATHALAMTYRPHRAERMLTEAVVMLRKSPTKLGQAMAQRDLATILRENHRTEAAAENLAEAHALAMSCGAKRLAAEIDADRPVVRDVEKSRTTSDILTKQERRTTSLAISGMTNRQIAEQLWVTQRCVEGHLSSAYRKLGISRRTELSGALARHEGTGNNSSRNRPVGA